MAHRTLLRRGGLIHLEPKKSPPKWAWKVETMELLFYG
ncbi:hypothetical protein Q670_12790 [Alcanivorax sp. P2S70]|nr:hypothetical protein Q670_12790 [Alcanivorax sp. P2S70]